MNEAKVLAVGPGGLSKDGTRIAPSVAPGDKVLIPQVRSSTFSPKNFVETFYNEILICSQYGGSVVKVGEEEYSLFRDHE